MRKIFVNPEKIFGFQPNKGLAFKIYTYVCLNGWDGIPLVPIFKIPEDIRVEDFRYVLADGHHRMKIAIELRSLLPCALFNKDETIKPDGIEIAHFRHSSDKNLYEKLIRFYKNRYI